MSKFYFIILFLLFSNIIIAQSVTGVILNEKGLPLPGANIVDRSQNAYTISRKDGSFKLQIDTAVSSIIQVSYLGFKLQELPYSTIGGRNINLGKVQMEPALT